MKATLLKPSRCPRYQESTSFVWRDLNGNRNYDAGEVNLDPNGADYVSQTGTTTAILNSNESTPITNEFSVSLERQLAQNMAIRVSGIYTRSSNNAIVTGLTPGRSAKRRIPIFRRATIAVA